MKSLLFVILIAFSLAATEEVNSKDTTWKAKAPINGEHLKTLLGALPSPKNGKRTIVSWKGNNDDLPESFNPIEKWPMCKSLVEIRDQSTCGSCWAFGAVEAATDRLCIHSKGAHTEPLSSEDMLTCCSSCGFGCSGGWPIMAWDYMNTDGVVTGDECGDNSWCSPYAFPKCDHHVNGTYGPCGDTQPTPECVKKCSSEYGVEYEKDKHYFREPYYVADDEESIMRELYENGPIEVAFTVYADFLTYSSGVYQYTTGGYLGGHAVKMVGWGVENGVKYWTVANSWNENWGDHGYFKIIRGVNECGIEGQAVAGMPKL